MRSTKSPLPGMGDFQTPAMLATAVCDVIKRKGIEPDMLVEPSCGEGQLVVAALKAFPKLKAAYCVELQAGHKAGFLRNVSSFVEHVKIEYIEADAFQHEFPVSTFSGKKVLILGNPPWVTNTQQSRLGSTNVPRKSNVKHIRGIEAMTGKGNFDIAEALVARVAGQLGGTDSWIGMICKTTVIRNLVRDAKLLGLHLSEMEMHGFDASKAFGVATSGAFFFARNGHEDGVECAVYDLFDLQVTKPPFGWHGGKFVSDIPSYKEMVYLDGTCPCTWRQGVKHDAVQVMLLKRNGDGTLANGLGEAVSVEPEVIFPMVKGSKLRDVAISASDTYTIITQATLAEDTSVLESTAPRAWQYLVDHAGVLDGRKSAIYKNRPRFCLFGVGEYAFKPFKVAIASFYKDPRFSLVLPVNGKPMMLDDTCYYLAFDDVKEAICIIAALNSPPARAFLEAISFRDGKRIYSKEILSRINVASLLRHPGFESWATFTLKDIATHDSTVMPLQKLVETRDRILNSWA
jgi:hypothetical protein